MSRKEKSSELSRLFASQRVCLRMIAAWLSGVVVFHLRIGGAFHNLDRVADTGIAFSAAAAVTVFAGMTLWDYGFPRADAGRTALPWLFGVYTILLVREEKAFPFLLLLSAVWGVLFYIYLQADNKKVLRFSKRRVAVFAAAAAVLFVSVVAAQGVFRYLTFNAPNFDFGIFCQAFYSMKTRLLPLVTCERDRLLSHFAVHVSPALYLFLPVYAVFDSPVTLQILQAIVLGSAVIPAGLLGKAFSLSPKKTAVLIVMVLFHPAVGNGTNYDFHENCFLFPFLLWTFYLFEVSAFRLSFLFALLTMSVKEDAAVYILIFAIYVLCSGGRKKFAFALASVAVCWFCFCVILLTKWGDGVMVSRYGNFVAGEGGLLAAARTVLADPGYVFTQLYLDRDGVSLRKGLYLLQMLAPLGLFPLRNRNVSRWILLFPLILLNLMTLYPYQFDIGFQYSFGSAAFLVYLTAMNMRDAKNEAGKALLCAGAVLCVLSFWGTNADRAVSYLREYDAGRKTYTAAEEALREIPGDASVVCSTWIVPHLSQRERLYETAYHDPGSCELPDYVVLDLRSGADPASETYKSLGYAQISRVPAGGGSMIEILRRPEDSADSGG